MKVGLICLCLVGLIGTVAFLLAGALFPGKAKEAAAPAQSNIVAVVPVSLGTNQAVLFLREGGGVSWEMRK